MQWAWVRVMDDPPAANDAVIPRAEVPKVPDELAKFRERIKADLYRAKIPKLQEG